MHVILKPTKAELTHDCDTLGKMDPYIRIDYAGRFYQSQISTVRGKNPVWNEAFDLVVQGDGGLKLSVFDYDGNSDDDLVGDCLLNLNQLAKFGNNNSWFDLFYNGAPAGKIWVDVFVVPTVGPVVHITPLRAELTKDTELVGKMDPYVRLHINGNSFTTAIHKDGGKTPIWHDSFAIPLVGNGAAQLTVWDWDGAKSDYIGELEFNLFTLIQGGQQQAKELFHKGKKTGVIYLQVQQVSK